MNKRTIAPIVGALDATVTVPGSKSITNRALVVAALAEGSSTIRNIGLSDDTEAMIGALGAFGCRVDRDGVDVVISGRSGALRRPAGPIDARQSGTTARFVTAMLLCSGGGSIDAAPQMRDRPMRTLVEAMRKLGASVDSDRLPLTVEVDAPLGSSVSMEADVSSQFISALLLVAPSLPAGLELTLTGQEVSGPYVDMTIEVMRRFGATVERRESSIDVAATGYRATDLLVEPDASTATYPLAAAAIVGGRVRIAGLGSSSMQGDVGFAKVLETMGAEVSLTPGYLEVRGSGELEAADVDLGGMSDTAPTFAAVAARAKGRSTATGIGFIRGSKESDRVAGAVAELRRLGLQATIEDDGFCVMGGKHHSADVETYDDHRMAMAFALLGLVDEPVTILDPGCVAKTFPHYFEMLDDLRASARTTPLVLAIDGPAGSGKSTVASLVAERLRLPHLDTGAMYRAVTLAVLRAEVGIEDEAAVSAAAESATIEVGAVVRIDGEDVSKEIRSPEVTAMVSPVATVGGVRSVLAGHQRTWATKRGAAVVEGRDIGSAVFPEATLKIFLTASVDERAQRRAAEIGMTDMDEMRRRLVERDEIDTNREHDPLTIVDDAHVIDSTELEIGHVVDTVVALWEEVVQR